MISFEQACDLICHNIGKMSQSSPDASNHGQEAEV
jgi:hypothetical protein